MENDSDKEKWHRAEKRFFFILSVWSSILMKLSLQCALLEGGAERGERWLIGWRALLEETDRRKDRQKRGRISIEAMDEGLEKRWRRSRRKRRASSSSIEVLQKYMLKSCAVVSFV